MRSIIIFGSGLTTKTILDNYQKSGIWNQVVGIVDDNESIQGREVYGKVVLGKRTDLTQLISKHGLSEFIIGVGSVKHHYLRPYLFGDFVDLGLKPVNSISPNAYFAEDSKIGLGNLILPFAMIGAGVVIKNNASIHANVSILEDTIINDNAAICSNSFVGGKCLIEENTYIGPGTTIASGVIVGRNSIVGAGSVLLKDVPEGVMGFGNPFQVKSENKYLK